MHPSPPPHMPKISLFFIWSHEYRLVRGTCHEAPHYSLLHPTATIVHLGPKYLPQYTTLKHPMHMSLLQCARRTFIPSPHRRNYMFVHFRASHFPTAKISAPAVLILKRWSSSHRMRQQYWQLYDMAIWKHLPHLKYWCVPTKKKKNSASKMMELSDIKTVSLMVRKLHHRMSHTVTHSH